MRLVSCVLNFFQLGACKDGAVMRAFPSHTNVAWVGILGFVNLSFFFSFSGSLVFIPSQKPTLQIPIDMETVNHEPLCGMCHCQFQFI